MWSLNRVYKRGRLSRIWFMNIRLGLSLQNGKTNTNIDTRSNEMFTTCSRPFSWAISIADRFLVSRIFGEAPNPRSCLYKDKIRNKGWDSVKKRKKTLWRNFDLKQSKRTYNFLFFSFFWKSWVLYLVQPQEL